MGNQFIQFINEEKLKVSEIKDKIIQSLNKIENFKLNLEDYNVDYKSFQFKVDEPFGKAVMKQDKNSENLASIKATFEEIEIDYIADVVYVSDFNISRFSELKEKNAIISHKNLKKITSIKFNNKPISLSIPQTGIVLRSLNKLNINDLINNKFDISKVDGYDEAKLFLERLIQIKKEKLENTYKKIEKEFNTTMENVISKDGVYAIFKDKVTDTDKIKRIEIILSVYDTETWAIDSLSQQKDKEESNKKYLKELHSIAGSGNLYFISGPNKSDTTVSF